MLERDRNCILQSLYALPSVTFWKEHLFVGSENRTSENFPVIQDNLDFVFCQRSIIYLDRDFFRGGFKRGYQGGCI